MVKFHQDRRIYCLGSEQKGGDTFSESTKKFKERDQTFIKSFVLSFVSAVSQRGQLVHLKGMGVKFAVTNEG